MSKVSRRSVLAGGSALGGGLLLPGGCDSSSPARTPRLAFVGQDPQRGHLLRAAASTSGSTGAPLRTKVLIVGGGVAGHGAAWRLRRAGVEDIQQIELEDASGGTSRSGALPRSAYPMGAHYLPSPHPECGALEVLLRDLGVIVRQAPGDSAADERVEYRASAICAAPLERHFAGGRWDPGLYPAGAPDRAGIREESPDEAAQFEQWRDHLRQLDRRRGKGGERLFRLPVRRSAPDLRHLDQISMATYMDGLGLDSWRLRWLVDYACRDDYGCRLHETSAFAALHHFLARGLEETRERYILTAPGGNGDLVEAMVAHANLGDRYRVGHAATAIDPASGHAEVHSFETGKTHTVEAEVILWAAPRFVLSALLRGADPLPMGALGYSPWLVASLELDNRPLGFGAPLAWDNVPIEGTNLGYVLATHGDDRGETDPASVITYYEPQLGDPRAARRRLLDATLPGLAAGVFRSLAHMHPGMEGHTREMHIARWGHAMIRPIPGLLFGETLARARTPIGKVIPCATDTAGLPLFEEAFYAGTGAAEQALEII